MLGKSFELDFIKSITCELKVSYLIWFLVLIKWNALAKLMDSCKSLSKLRQYKYDIPKFFLCINLIVR